MFLESFGWFMLGAGSVILGLGGVIAGERYLAYRRAKKKLAVAKRFHSYVEKLKNSVDEALTKDVVPPPISKEISELTFRDKDNQLCTVKIVVDHNLDVKLTDDDKARMREMIEQGENAGTLDDLLTNHVVTEDRAGQVQEFVFSSMAVQRMRQAGLEPDEVVTKMLRASGRIT